MSYRERLLSWGLLFLQSTRFEIDLISTIKILLNIIDISWIKSDYVQVIV